MFYQHVFFLCLGCATGLVQAQQLSGFAGALSSPDPRAHTFSWEMDYLHQLNDNAALSAGWINEGHLPGHHRDGALTQIWWRGHPFDPRLTLAAGIGPYAYFDTVPTEDGDGSHDDHGLGGIASVDARWTISGPWSIDLRYNHIATDHGTDTDSIMLGVAYALDHRAPNIAISPEPQGTGDSEVDVLFGRTIVNTLESEDSFAGAVDYRQRLSPYLAWSVGLLNEGDARTQRRSGVVAQVWAGREFPDQRIAAAIGIGPYVVLDIQRNPLLVEASRERLAGILSLTGSYEVTKRWVARLTWHRVFAEKSHDSDVLVLGGGYRF